MTSKLEKEPSNQPDQLDKKRSTSDALENVNCPIFLRKTYHMIDTCDEDVAGWSDDGMSFIIKNQQLLASKFLPQYFKHNHFSSFVRQLNFYSFRKEKNESIPIINHKLNDDRWWYFRHESFVKDKPDLLCKISRRIPNKSSKSGGNSNEAKDGKNDNQHVEQRGLDQKEHQILQNEIASLKNKMISMEKDMDELSKALTQKLQLKPTKVNENTKQKEGSFEVEKEVPAPPGVESMNKRQKCTKNVESITICPGVINIRTKVNNLKSPRKSKTVSPNGPFKVTESDHVASTALPDLAEATDEDLVMKDVELLSRSSSMGKILEDPQQSASLPLSSSGESLAAAIVAEVDQMFASMSNDMNATVTNSTQGEVIGKVQPLPDFVPTRDQEHTLTAIKQIENLELCLKELPVGQRNKFTNEILNEVSTVFNDTAVVDNDPEDEQNKLMKALERILSSHLSGKEGKSNEASTKCYPPNNQNVIQV